MAEVSREQLITEAFVTVADTLIDDYDVIDLLHTLVDVCTSVLDVDAGGLLLADESGDLQLVASTSERADFVEIMQLAAGVGPCLDCFSGGMPVSVADIDREASSGRPSNRPLCSRDSTRSTRLRCACGGRCSAR